MKRSPFTRERDFQAAVCELAKTFGCLVYHTHDSRRSEPGFPDLVIVGRRGVLFRELKIEGGRLTPAQESWIYALQNAQADAMAWYPKDWPRRVTEDLRAIA